MNLSPGGSTPYRDGTDVGSSLLEFQKVRLTNIADSNLWARRLAYSRRAVPPDCA